MPTFKDSADLQTVLGGFFSILVKDEGIGGKLKESKLIIKFNYKKPELAITANCAGLEIALSFNDASTKPEVEMFMDADVAHKFWLGEVNLVMALARRQMVVKGPIPRILKLLPVIKPAYKMYKEYLTKIGRA
jgi:putative sterol carrier protein